MASPFLMLPLAEENTIETNHLCLYSLKHKKPYKLDLLQNFIDFRCVGSSHGWLAFLDEKENPFLLNPFSGARIYLPPKHTLPCINPRAQEKGFRLYSKIQKVVLSGNPYSHAKNNAVIVMYSFESQTKIAFCKYGDEEWSDLDCKGETYYDVVCCDQTNTAFALGPGPRVESWDLNQTIPKKKMIIQDSCPTTLQLARKTFPSHLYASQWYLALSLGQIFLLVRYIGEFVRYDGEVAEEGDTLTDYAAEPLVCPYRTVDFHVFKLDADQKKWIEVESLNDFALFLGGNQSMMVSTIEHPELKRNAIYFTDDYWDRMNEDYSYGGHDMGIFMLEDGSVEQILDSEEQKIEPPPFWISLPTHDLCNFKKRKVEEFSWISL